MSKLNRRAFIKLIGQGTAALGIGMGLSQNAWAQTGGAKAVSGTKGTADKYQVFTRGKYLDWEKAVVEQRIAQAKAFGTVGGGAPGGGAGAENPMTSGRSTAGGQGPAASAVTEAEVLKYNSTWDPYNPLFNNKAYAQKAGYTNLPAWPCFKTPSSTASMGLTIPQDLADEWYPSNDGTDAEFLVPIYPGDSFTSETENVAFEDITVDGSDLRVFKITSAAKMFNQRGELVARSTGYLRNGYKKIIDGSKRQTYTEFQSSWVPDFPEGHYTTDEEWEYIIELWKKEKIRGSEKLYWDDVKVGDEPTWTCSGPISYLDMGFLHGAASTSLRNRPSITNLDKTMFRDRFGIFLPDNAQHYGGRNIPGARAIFYNNTACNFIIRMLTNYIGDAGFVTRVRWIFIKVFKEMRIERPGGEYLDLVPYMKGKGCTHHGSEGDTVIAKGYVTKKYKNDKGEGIIDLTCWAETLDNRLVEVVAASAKLPLRKG